MKKNKKNLKTTSKIIEDNLKKMTLTKNRKQKKLKVTSKRYLKTTSKKDEDNLKGDLKKQNGEEDLKKLEQPKKKTTYKIKQPLLQ